MKKPTGNKEIDTLLDQLILSLGYLDDKVFYVRNLLSGSADIDAIKLAAAMIEAQAKDIKFLADIIHTSVALLLMEKEIYGSRI